MRERMKNFATGLGMDDVGIAAVKDYKSPRSPDLQSIFPGAKSLVVLAYKELSNCESENMQIATGGRLDALEFDGFPITKWHVFLRKNLRPRQ